MRVVCENCGTTYKIPETKLTKEVNKATCRKCGFRMMIRRPSAAASTVEDIEVDPDEAATQVAANPLDIQDNEREMLEANTRIQKGAVDEWNDDLPTNVQADPSQPPPAGSAAPPASGAGAAPGGARAEKDMILALVATFASAGGAMLLATNTGDIAGQRMLGLGVALWGALTCLFLLVTGNLWRQKGNLPISIALATVLSAGGAAFVEIALHDGEGIGGLTITRVAEAPSETESEAVANETDEDNADPAAADDGENADEAADGDVEEELADDAAAADDNSEDYASDKPSSRSTRDRSARNADTPEEDAPEDELDLEDPIEDFDDLGDAGIAANDANDAPSDMESAEERRRQEMEAAANKRASERKRRAKENEERKAQERARDKASAKKAESSGAMTTLPLTVVDTMIRSNMSVKRCFFNEKQESGEMPRRVNVRFTVLSSGSVSSARITTDQYKGGNLDSCLSRAFKSIQFPPFQGEAKSMTYPFVL